MSVVVFVSPHPDDLELGAFGALAYSLERGFKVLCIYVTRGERGGTPEVREAESRAALKKVGVTGSQVVFGPFTDTRIPDSYKTIKFLEDECRTVDGDIYAAFVPSEHERHQDHRNLALSCQTAFRHCPIILGYESASATAEFKPTTFVDITRFIDLKNEALQCHKSQMTQQKMYLEYRAMVSLAAFRGRQAGVEFAEAFETHRYVIDVPKQ
jgi:LmbE family N-acetylglucosaminyl deacetylase